MYLIAWACQVISRFFDPVSGISRRRVGPEPVFRASLPRQSSAPVFRASLPRPRVVPGVFGGVPSGLQPGEPASRLWSITPDPRATPVTTSRPGRYYGP